MIVGYDNLRKNQIMTIATSSGDLVRLGVVTLLLSAPTQSLLSASTQSLAADSLDEVIAGAKEEGSVSLYEGQQPQAWTKIMAAFQKRYPFVTSYNQERLVAGATVTRVITEAMAGISNADIVASGTVQMDDFDLLDRGRYRHHERHAGNGYRTNPRNRYSTDTQRSAACSRMSSATTPTW